MSERSRNRDDSLADAHRDARRRTLVRALLLLAATPIAVFLLLALWIGVTGRYRDVPVDVYESGDLTAIGRALRGDPNSPQIRSEGTLRADDPFRVDLPPEVIRSKPLEAVDPLLVEAAERWVREVNRASPQAILYHEVDAHANLYLFPSAWLYEFDLKTISRSTQIYGEMWQQYMFDAFGDWNHPEIEKDEVEYAPGVIFVDCQGEVSRMMAGYVRVLRTPVTCD